MVLSLMEIVDIIFMSAVLGIIFKDIFSRYRNPFSMYGGSGFDWDGFKFAIMVTAPAVILHEFGHKFVALAFGASAVFKAAYGWLLFGVLLKMLNVGFIFFVPAYVSIIGDLTPISYSLIAFAGPAVNLIIWIGAKIALEKNMVSKKYLPIVFLTKQVNMFLFIFNMLPIPGFDGFKVYSGLFHTFF